MKISRELHLQVLRMKISLWRVLLLLSHYSSSTRISCDQLTNCGPYYTLLGGCNLLVGGIIFWCSWMMLFGTSLAILRVISGIRTTHNSIHSCFFQRILDLELILHLASEKSRYLQPQAATSSYLQRDITRDFRFNSLYACMITVGSKTLLSFSSGSNHHHS